MAKDVLDLLRERKIYATKRMCALTGRYWQELGEYIYGTGFWIKGREQKFG